MAKHGKQLLDDTKNTIVQLMEGGYRASEVANILNKGNNKITEQSYKGKVKTHKYINRQNQSTTGKL